MWFRVFLTISIIGSVAAVRCYSGMQGSVNGDSIGQIEIVDCNGTDFCVKLPSRGHVGRKHYEGAQYSCDFGECRKETCEKRDNGETICCCKDDESLPLCNLSPTLSQSALRLSLFIMARSAFNKFFLIRPNAKKHFINSDNIESFANTERMKGVFLKMNRNLLKGLEAYSGDFTMGSITEVLKMWEELGKEHRAITPFLTLENYMAFFEMLPKFLTDFLSFHRKKGQFTINEYEKVHTVWKQILDVLRRRFVKGWNESLAAEAIKKNAIPCHSGDTLVKEYVDKKSDNDDCAISVHDISLD
ncbi:unnamed protein product [Caenorhabditis bovis]|uniref:Globin family profile domain-containing protein n=1 Tax=Caenorhabditis bovis TaxID=2654633 RepID=A0A8S1EN85_9PELO|nr:unnamed protein product [Caenorhabditis bovis]